jgi:GT2 family glycosyltransferase
MSVDPPIDDVALVAIGRNEGDRLRRCLESSVGRVSRVVYVDSGSTDGSAELAARMGAEVAALDTALPFTAARARNEGARRALRGRSGTRYLQFVDGDCEVAPKWLGQAKSFLDAHPAVVAVCGRRRERFPDQSIYNRLCDTEWDTPVGSTRAFGGDVMVRVDAFNAAGGYRDELIAGEDPELAIRLRQAGGQLWRLDIEMTLHDAAMTRFSQWWKRSVRAGYAFALGAFIHGAPPERHWVRESRRAWLWGLLIPLMGAAGPLSGHPMLAGVVALLYLLQWSRLFVSTEGTLFVKLARSTFLVLGKFAEAVGQVKFCWHRMAGVQAGLIEYR